MTVYVSLRETEFGLSEVVPPEEAVA
jgi:hypothetical protein